MIADLDRETTFVGVCTKCGVHSRQTVLKEHTSSTTTFGYNIACIYPHTICCPRCGNTVFNTLGRNLFNVGGEK